MLLALLHMRPYGHEVQQAGAAAAAAAQQSETPCAHIDIQSAVSQDICTTSWDPSCRRECICTNDHGDMRHMCTPCICRHSKQDPVRWSENLHKQKEAEVLDMLQAFLKSTSQPTRPHNRSIHAYMASTMSNVYITIFGNELTEQVQQVHARIQVIPTKLPETNQTQVWPMSDPCHF